MKVRLVLDWLNLPELRDKELRRIEHEYDQSMTWTENDRYEKRTMSREGSAKGSVATAPIPTSSGKDLLSTQIAHREKKQTASTVVTNFQYSTPCVTQVPRLDEKLSPIEKLKPLTRVHSETLKPIDENTSFEDDELDRKPVKRLKVEPVKEKFFLNNLDEIKEDDLNF